MSHPLVKLQRSKEESSLEIATENEDFVPLKLPESGLGLVLVALLRDALLCVIYFFCNPLGQTSPFWTWDLKRIVNKKMRFMEQCQSDVRL